MKLILYSLLFTVSTFAHSSACDKYKVKQDYINHFDCVSELAESGYAPSQLILGAYYENGVQTEKNIALAEKWYRKASEQGLEDAQLNLGAMLVKQGRYDESITWFLKAAEQGLADAQFNLGIMYNKGQGVEQNSAQAFYWFEKAANQHHTTSQYNLGLMYKQGYGVAKNTIKAVYWFTKAAEQGHTKAQNNLGVAYEFGEGVQQNLSMAKHYYGLACDKGHQKGCANYARLNEQSIK